jgi:hypothetical protein
MMAASGLPSGKRTALMLGAGFSKWSCDLPLVSELFDFKIRTYNQTEERRVIRLKKIYESWRAKNLHEHIEEFIRFSQGPGLRFNLTNWYITRRLTEPFVVHGSRRYTWYINSYYTQQHKGIEKARGIITALSGISGAENLSILTANYDLVPEYALGTRGFNYGILHERIGYTPYPYPRPVFVTGPVSIAKLHGSISWTEDAKFPDSRCGLTGKCLIVPPVTGKKAPKLLEDQWTLAKKILVKCHKLVVFGFSFNEYDTAIRDFFKAQLSPDAEVTLVDVVDHRTRLAPILGSRVWPAPGFEDTELGVFTEPEVSHGETEVYPRVQA